jgi:taurine dioxygenase
MATASTSAAVDYRDPGVYRVIKIARLGSTFGAEVSGVSLSSVDDRVFEEIYDAFLRYKVLFFRAQTEIRPPDMHALAQRFGDVDVPPKALKTCDDVPSVAIIETNSEHRPYVDFWHTDLAYKKRPALVSILRSRLIPPVGGDTLWVDMDAAYDGLPAAMKERLARLRTFNSYRKTLEIYNSYAESEGREPIAESVIQQRVAEHPPVEHPLVRTHPVTGRKSVYMSINATVRIVGLDPEESDELIDFLYRLSDKPEHQVRWRWEPDTVALWDNRCTRHYATADYFPERRIMERVMVIGEVPA